MAAEQASLDRDRVGPPADVFALGAILRALLAGQLPSSANPSPAIAKTAPRPLRAIVTHCIQANPHDRYQSAESLAADLRRFLRGAHGPAANLDLRTARTWSAQYRKAALAAVVIAVAGVLSWSLRSSAERQAPSAILPQREPKPTAASGVPDPLVHDLSHYWRAEYVSDIQTAAHLLLTDQNTLAAQQILDRWAGPFSPARPDPRRFEWGYLQSAAHNELFTLQHAKRKDGLPTEIYHVRFSADSSILVSAGQDRTARLWNASTGEPFRTPLPHPDEVNWADLSQDGRLVATASDDGAVRLWDVASGQLAKKPLVGHGGKGVVCVLFRPDGKTLISSAQTRG